MQTNSDKPVPPAEANDSRTSRTASDEAVVCKELLGCPFCGSLPTISELRYVNTGRLYGYWLKCDGCGLEIKEAPVCWPAGKENEEMKEAKVALVNRWNRRFMGKECMNHSRCFSMDCINNGCQLQR